MFKAADAHKDYKDERLFANVQYVNRCTAWGHVMFSDFLTMDNLLLIASGLVIVIILLVADRLVRRAISRYSEGLKLEPHAENIFKLTARIIIAAVGVVALLSLFNVDTTWFVGVSALTGAAIGFASTQTVGNFLAGLYIMISRPFMIKDYVKIGDIRRSAGDNNQLHKDIHSHLQYHGDTKQEGFGQHHSQLFWQKRHN